MLVLRDLYRPLVHLTPTRWLAMALPVVAEVSLLWECHLILPTLPVLGQVVVTYFKTCLVFK